MFLDGRDITDFDVLSLRRKVGMLLQLPALFQGTVADWVGGMEDSFLASFLLGWGITIGAGLASYPIDTVRRRMMMTSGEAVKYSSSAAAFKQIIKNEGASSLFKGAGANILRTVAGAGVLAGYDMHAANIAARST